MSHALETTPAAAPGSVTPPATVRSLAVRARFISLAVDTVGVAGFAVAVGLGILYIMASTQDSAPSDRAEWTNVLIPPVVLGFLGLLLLVALRAVAAALRLLCEQTEAVSRIEQQLTAGLERLAAVIESRPAAATAPSDAKVQRLAEIRHAVRTGAWDEATSLVRSFAVDHPDDPDASRLTAEVAEARQAAAQEVLAKVAAAREANDPERVIELRDQLKPLVEPDDLRKLDRDLAGWFMLLIHRRLRSGTVRPDVAALAARVAGSLDGTPEGASLRASLPTLRRAAGLCPRCAQPYTGIENACPACLAGVSVATAPTPTTPAPVPPADDLGD